MLFPIDFFFRIGYLGAAVWVLPYFVLAKKKAVPTKIAVLANWIAAFYALCVSLLGVVTAFRQHMSSGLILLLFFSPLLSVVILAFLFKRKPVPLMLPFCLLLNFGIIYTHIFSLFLNPAAHYVPMTDTDRIIEDFFQKPYLLPIIAIPFEFLLWIVYLISWWVEKVTGKQNISQPDAP